MAGRDDGDGAGAVPTARSVSVRCRGRVPGPSCGLLFPSEFMALGTDGAETVRSMFVVDMRLPTTGPAACMPVAYFSMEARPYPGVGLRLSQSSLDEARVCKLISGPGRVRPLLAAADEEILPGGIGLPTHKMARNGCGTS